MLTFRFSKFNLALIQFFFSFAFGCFKPANAQYFLPIGSRANSMGGATITLPDAFSVFSNPASSMLSEQNSVGMFYDNRYNIAGLSNIAIAGNYKIKKSALSAGISKSGDQLLNYNRCEIAFSQKIRNVSLGGGAGYHQVMISENGAARNITFQFGGIAEITPKLTYGAHVYNISRSKISKEKSIYYPVIMRMGISYKAVKNVFLSIEIEKDNRFDPNVKAGMEYKPLDYLFIRTGFNTNPSNSFFGLGFKLKGWIFDYGISYHKRLGLTHYVGLVFGLSSSKPAKDPVTSSSH